MGSAASERKRVEGFVWVGVEVEVDVEVDVDVVLDAVLK